MTKTLRTAIPFPGFYNSLLDSGYHWTIELASEYYTREYGIDESTSSDCMYKHMDTRETNNNIARIYVDNWLESFSDETWIDTQDCVFDKMESPRFYNFETDRVFANVPKSVFLGCYLRANKDKFKTLKEVINDRFTSYDGFLSFYSTDLESWLSKPLSQWDENELETLLIATLALSVESVDSFNSEVEEQTHEYCSGNGVYDEGFNWAAIETELGIES